MEGAAAMAVSDDEGPGPGKVRRGEPIPASGPIPWGDIAGRVAERFGLDTLRSPTLKVTIERGVRYLVRDDSAKALVFDTHALFMGLLSAGRQDADSIRYGATASWFADWLETRLGVGAVGAALSQGGLTDPEAVAGAMRLNYDVILSVSVNSLLVPAAQFAVDTVGRNAFEARHLFAAMLDHGSVTDQTLNVFKHTLTTEELTSLKQIFVQRIMTTPEPQESLAAWRSVLKLPPDPAESGANPNTPPPTPPPPPPAAAFDGVTDFRRDAVYRPQQGTDSDVLRTAADARALARLMCLEGAAPLAIAIFGGWGSGKSTFMERLDRDVRDIAANEAARLAEVQAAAASGAAQADGAGTAQFVTRVVQIRFNAWQFVDANLWASLTAEFFDQLRAGGWDRSSKVRYAGLVEAVNSHVHALNDDAQSARRAASAGGQTLLAAQTARDKAGDVARHAGAKVLGHAAVDLLGEAFEAQKGNLSALGLAVTGEDTGKAVDAILDAVRSSRTFAGRLGAVARLTARAPARVWLGVGAVVLTAAAALIWLERHSLSWSQIAAPFLAIGALGAAASSLAPAIRLVGGVAARGAAIAKAVDDADRDAAKALLTTEIALRDAATEAQALQAAADQASARLSRYIDPAGLPNPPRLLRYVLEDDPNTKALQSELGLIGRTRRLFQAVDDIVSEARDNPKAADPETPQRIVLYIDDLDRCSEEQVYNVLQAIHLLLAFELFVVVVGVDVAWVQDALKRRFGASPDAAVEPIGAVDPDPAPPSREALTREAIKEAAQDSAQQAARYLDKIFQIAFWLSPLRGDGAQDGAYGRYVKALADPPARESAAAAAATPPGQVPPGGSPAAAPAGAGTAGASPPPGAAGAAPPPPQPPPRPPPSAAKAREALATIRLEPSEVDFLASPWIEAIAGSTPRAVKRLMNVYRLVRTRLSEEPGGATAPERDYPMIALAVAVETGQPVKVADDFYEGLNSLGQGEPGAPSPAVKALRDACAAAPGLQGALEEVARVRGGLAAADALRIARVARRYSFNRYR
jgi:hypothetical protein